MSNQDASYTTPDDDAPRAAPERAPFPWQRLLLSILFGFLAWFAFWFTIVLAIIMWVLIAVSREPHAEFKQFVNGCARYVWQCLGYIVMLHEDKPFPLGPLPRGD